MKTEVEIFDVTCDVTVVKELIQDRPFQLMIYPDIDDVINGNSIGMWVESESNNIQDDFTLMFNLSKENALFFGKALIAMAEALPTD